MHKFIMQKILLTIHVIKNAPLELDEDHEVVNPPILLQKNYEANIQSDANVDSFFSFSIPETVEFNELKSKLFFDVSGNRIGSDFYYLQVQVNDGASRYDGKNSVRNILKIPLHTLNDLAITLDSSQGEERPSFFSRLQFVFKFSVVKN